MNLNFSKNRKSITVPIEVDLIRACARLEMTTPWQARVESMLGQDLDWTQVRDLANHHRVFPLVYRNLYTTFQDQVPEQILAEFRIVYQTNAARNLFLTNELLKILQSFEAQGIDVIPFKGPTLAKKIYGDEVLRQFDDLDVLVHEGDVGAVSELLLSMGYMPALAAVGPEAEPFLRNEGECGFSSSCGHYKLDVHGQMVPRSFLDLDQAGLWERAGSAYLGGRQIRALSSQDLIMLLVIHGMRHLWARQSWIHDFALAIQKNPDLDWDGLFDHANSIKGERLLNVGLLMANQYYSLDFPKWVCDQIQADHWVGHLVNTLFDSPNFHKPGGASYTRLHLLNAQARVGMRDKVQYCLGQLLSPGLADWSFIKMPGPMSFLYGVIRPLRVLKEYALKPLSRKLATLLGIYL